MGVWLAPLQAPSEAVPEAALRLEMFCRFDIQLQPFAGRLECWNFRGPCACSMLVIGHHPHVAGPCVVAPTHPLLLKIATCCLPTLPALLPATCHAGVRTPGGGASDTSSPGFPGCCQLQLRMMTCRLFASVFSAVPFCFDRHIMEDALLHAGGAVMARNREAQASVLGE